jgi:uncharacterized RDD family membrane protein YckC
MSPAEDLAQGDRMFCTHCGVALYEGAAFCSGCGQAVSGSTAQAAPRKVAYAGFWLRLVAWVIDSLVLVIPTSVIVAFAVAFLGLELPPPEAMQMGRMPPMRFFLPMEALSITVQWLYFALMESSSWQGTLGKRALGVGVSDSHGKRISFGRASVRSFGKLVSSMTFLVGYVMAGFTERKQALHDIIADCIVVKMP